jgi:AcrR family transcriptional regulator
MCPSAEPPARAAIVQAARELFAERGYGGAGEAALARHAGIELRELRESFPEGPDELFRAVFARVAAALVARVAAAARGAPGAWAGVRAGCETFLDAATEAEVQRILLLDGPAVLGAEVWKHVSRDYVLARLQAALQDAIDRGELPPPGPPPDALAYVVLGELEQAALVIARSDDAPAARAEMGVAVGRLLDGLAVPGAVRG